MKSKRIQYVLGIPATVLLFALVLLSLPALCHGQTASNPRVPATVHGYESAMLYSKVGGYIKSVSVNIGDAVKAGDTLAVIDVPEMAKKLAQKQSLLALAKAKADQAKARIDEANAHLEALQAGIVEAKSTRSQKQALFDFERTECERLARLVSTGAVQAELVDGARYKMRAAESGLKSVDAKVATATANLTGGKASVRRAQADAAAAAAEVDVAQADIDYVVALMQYATIRAPWDGKITERMYDAGSFVQSAEGNSAAKPILKLVRDDIVRVTFSLSQKDIKGLEKGVRVTLSEIDALPGETFEGTVSRYSAELDSQTRMMRVEMDLENGAELSLDAEKSRLKPGFFGYATVHFNE